jgi:hypothetical protein
MDPIDQLLQKYKVGVNGGPAPGAGGAPAPIPQSVPYTPTQQRVATPTGRPAPVRQTTTTTPIPTPDTGGGGGGLFEKMGGSSAGPRYDPNLRLWVNPKTGLPLSKNDQIMLGGTGVAPSGGGAGNPYSAGTMLQQGLMTGTVKTIGPGMYVNPEGIVFSLNRRGEVESKTKQESDAILQKLVPNLVTGRDTDPKVAQQVEVEAAKGLIDYNRKKMDLFAAGQVKTQAMRESVDRMKALMEQGVYSGPGTDIALPIQAALRNLGVKIGDDEKWDRTRALHALINETIPRVRETGSGSSSDPDMRLFKASLADITNSPNANMLIINGSAQALKHSDDLHAARERYFSAAKGQELELPGGNVEGAPKKTFTKQYGQTDLTGFEKYVKASGLDHVFKTITNPDQAKLVPKGEVYRTEIPVFKKDQSGKDTADLDYYEAGPKKGQVKMKWGYSIGDYEGG